ncbi:S-adenosyl-L-methionine-dependent methyltransferase [Lactarius hatsudake]|nr:S-adenosyl-L-methionine-dependent methyltransferase [Lactarius hatsudake]
MRLRDPQGVPHLHLSPFIYLTPRVRRLCPFFLFFLSSSSLPSTLVAEKYHPFLMTVEPFELSPISDMFDPMDNPYMPRSQQQIRLALDPATDLFLHRFPAFPPAAYAPAIWATGPVANEEETASDVDDIDDNSSDTIDPIEDHEFPTYFQQIGSPPRLFHSHGSYVLPVDSDETKRQEAQHILLRMIIGSNYDAPVRELLNSNPGGRKVVDLCTGAGHWVLDMAREFPHVRFRGLDLVPIQTRYPPENVRFEIADVTERLCFADASVDVVHARMACLSEEAVPGFLREVARILRPGGLFLSAEWDAHPALHPRHPWAGGFEDYIPQSITFYDIASIYTLITRNGSFEEPVSTRRVIPISTPHAPGSNGLRFVGEVMERISQGYADALVAGRNVAPGIAENFKAELSWRNGVVSVYQTVFARKMVA